MMLKTQMRDLIVVLPGITGSILQKNGLDVWTPSHRAILDLIRTWGESLEQLRLEGDDAEIDDLGDGIVATRLVPNAVLLAGLVKIDGYTTLSKTIKERFVVIDGTNAPADKKSHPPPNYFEFAYDWRRDNRYSARRLKQLIDLRLPAWQDYAGKDAKVILIAHSMGGLIARHYLEVLGGQENCKLLISLGTPYAGSLKALDFLANGFRKFFVDFSAITDPCTSFTSIYQLLPIYNVINTDTGCKKVSEVTLDGVRPKMAQQALAFHHQIMNCVDERVSKGTKAPCQILPVAGTYQPTLQSATLAGNKVVVEEVLPPNVDQLLWHGDGTVPFLSATPHEMAESAGKSFCVETHGTLQRNYRVLNLICDHLTDSQIKRPSLRGGVVGGPERLSLSLRVEDLYFANQPIVIGVRIFDGNHELNDTKRIDEEVGNVAATFEPVEDRVVNWTVPFRRVPNGWQVEQDSLPPGLYRVIVETSRQGPTAPFSVSDLFEVVPTA